MKKLFYAIIFLGLLFGGNVYSAETRTVEESDINVAWKVDGKFIKPECFNYIWFSGDRYEAFYDEYFKKLEASHWDDPKFRKFTENIGNYLNKEVPLNHSINPDWGTEPEISLTKQLEGCLTEKSETFIRFTSDTGSSNTVGYKVLHTFDPEFAKELAPYIDQKFESVKQVEIEEWGGGSLPPRTHMVVFGVLELEGKKVLLPLRNKSILTESLKRDSFFEPTGRYTYEAEFDLNDNITEIININDFKQIASSDGCFKINDFKKDGSIYKFLKENKLKKYCNEVRPFDDRNWLLNQREFKTNIDLLFRDTEHRFQNLIRSQVPDVQLPWSDDPYSLAKGLIDSVGYLPEDIEYLNNGKQVVVTGCVYKYCSQKGFIFIDKDNFIGLIRHSEEFRVYDFLTFSKTHKSFDEIPEVFIQSVKNWIADREIKITETKEKKSLGVRIEEVSKEIAEVEELKNTEGALVSSVGKDSPAEKAGLKAGDIILKFDGKKIVDYQTLIKVISGTEIDKTVKLKIWRNKKLFTANLTLVSTKTPGNRVRFIGSDNKINEVENLFVKKKIQKTKKKIKKIRKKVNEVEIVQGYNGVLKKQVAMKAEALTKNYNADLFDLINKKDTARNILKGREFEYALSREINDKFIDFKFEGKDRYSFLNEQFYHLLGHSSKKAYEVDINSDDFFIVTGCADPSCDEAGLLYIDKKNKVVVGSTNSKYFSDITNTDVTAMFVFTKQISELKELPKDFFEQLADLTLYMFNLNKRKGSMYFMGPNNKIRNITQLEMIGLDIKK